MTEQHAVGWRPSNEHPERGETPRDYSVDSEIVKARLQEVELRDRVLNGLSQDDYASKDIS